MHVPLRIQRQLNKNKPPIKLYWYRYRYPEKLNFGDEITPYIIDKLWGRSCEWSEPEECELAGAGSIIHILQRKAKGNRIKIWGSGFISGGANDHLDNLDFYAVRGYNTLGRITPKRKVILGDPGLLANRVFSKSNKVTYKVGIVAHYIDADNPLLDQVMRNPKYKIINPLDTPQRVAKEITACEMILSSSLHGLIFADSFSIPNYWMPLSGKVAGGDYKFKDYYSSTERELVQKSITIIGSDEEITKAITAYEPVRNLKNLQTDLIYSFPYRMNFTTKSAIAFVLRPSKWKKLFR